MNRKKIELIENFDYQTVQTNRIGNSNYLNNSKLIYIPTKFISIVEVVDNYL